jgi:hypothetical protein
MHDRGREGALVAVGAGLMLVILLVLQSFIGSGLLSRTTVTSVTTSSVTHVATTTVTEVVTSSQTYEIVESNITSPGQAGAEAYCSFGFPCPTGNDPMAATLVLYKSTYYYFSVVPMGINSPVVDYMVWYTNSTAFCITPKFGSWPACP